MGTIEYGYVTPDPLDPDIVYGGGRAEVTRFRWSTGEVQNVSPIPIRGTHRVDRTEPVIFCFQSEADDPASAFFCA